MSDPLNGLYQPVTDVDLGDLCTLHSGTGPFDWNDADMRLVAWEFVEREGGGFFWVPEFGAIYRSARESRLSGAAGGIRQRGCQCPPLCHPTRNVLLNLPGARLKTNGDESGWERTKAVDGDESGQSHWSGTPLASGVAGSWFAADLSGWTDLGPEIDGWRVFTDTSGTTPTTDSPQNIATEVRLYSTDDPAKWAALTHGSGLMTDDPVADLGWTLRGTATAALSPPMDTGRRTFTGSNDRYWLFKAISGGTSEWDVNEFELWSEYNHGTSPKVARCDHNHRVEHLRTNEAEDTTLHLHPDGMGGLEWGPETEHALDDLTDVDTASTPPTDGQALVYDDASGLWVPGDVAAGGGSANGAYAETIGDGSNTSYTVTHGLGSTDVIVQLYDMTGTDPVEATADAASITVDDANNVTIVFGSAPGTDDYRVVVLSSGAPQSPPFVGAKAYHSTTQSIPTATATALVLDSESWDTHGFHSTSSNTSRMTVPSGRAGKYLVRGHTQWDTNTSNERILVIRKNGSDEIGAGVSMSAAGAFPKRMEVSLVVDLAVGDYVELFVYQASGGNRTVGASNSFPGDQTSLEVSLLGT